MTRVHILIIIGITWSYSYNIKMKTYYVYIIGSKTGTLYVGMTNDIKRRVYEHKNHLVPGFTNKYNIECLLYFEAIGESASAINREKQIKTWRREKKVALIDSVNPSWEDLSEDWYE
jgi:putative endonuclease